MKSLQVSNLLLYPRIKKSVKDSIDSGVGMNVIENNIQMNNKMEEIHTMLIELLQACVDELKTQIKKFDAIEGNIEEVVEVKKALLKSFFSGVRTLMGKRFIQLGPKARSLIRNVSEINRLIWLLFNSDCVSFWTYLNDLRSNVIEDSFSIFSYCD